MLKSINLILFLLFFSISAFSQIILNPAVETVDDRLCYINKIERTSKYTIVQFEHINNQGWVNLNKDIYIESSNGKKYSYIKSEGIPLSPEKYSFKEGEGKLGFIVYFEPIPKDLKTINIFEKKGDRYSFNFYNVSLDKSRTNDIQIANWKEAEKAVDTAYVEAPEAPFFPGNGDAFIPMYKNILRTTLDVSLEYYQEADNLKKLAKVQKNYYDALIKEGFTKEQALQIILANPLGLKEVPLR